MKIAIICDYLKEGHGIYTHVHYLSRELIKKESVSKLYIITLGEHKLHSTNTNTATNLLEVIEIDRNEKPFFTYFWAPKKIKNLIEKLKPDVVHVHGTYPPYSIIPLITEKYPIVITLHGIVSIESNYSIRNKVLLRNIIYRKLEKQAIKQADRLIAVSPSIREICLKMGSSPSKIALIPNGIVIEEYEVESKNPISPSILYIGRLVKIKGIDILVKALPIIKGSYPNIKLYIAGMGGQYNKINSLVKRLDLTENVVFLGNVFGSEKRCLIASTDILVTPSRYEAFGIVILEAMASGKPVVASDVGGIPYIVDDGKTGLLFKDGDIDELAKNVLNLLTDKSTRLNMGRAGKEKAKLFSWEEIADETVKVYREICDQRCYN